MGLLVAGPPLPSLLFLLLKLKKRQEPDHFLIDFLLKFLLTIKEKKEGAPEVIPLPLSRESRHLPQLKLMFMDNIIQLQMEMEEESPSHFD